MCLAAERNGKTRSLYYERHKGNLQLCDCDRILTVCDSGNIGASGASNMDSVTMETRGLIRRIMLLVVIMDCYQYSRINGRYFFYHQPMN